MNKKVVVFFCSAFSIISLLAMQQEARRRTLKIESTELHKLTPFARMQLAAKLRMHLYKINNKPEDNCSYPQKSN